MKPWVQLARARAEGGGELTLHRRDDELVIRVDGHELMTTRRHASEERLAELGCRGLATAAPCVLVGGLGLGFTLRAALNTVGARGTVVVAEISADLVAWNRELLGPAAATTLADPRVRVHVGDVGELMRAPDSFDAILLDVDNSPHALTRPANAALYVAAGLSRARRTLRPGGRLAVWSAGRYPAFERRLAATGFTVEVHTAHARGARGGTPYTIYLGHL